MRGRCIVAVPPYTQWGAEKKGFAPRGEARRALVVPGGSVQDGPRNFPSPEAWLEHLRGQRNAE